MRLIEGEELEEMYKDFVAKDPQVVKLFHTEPGDPYGIPMVKLAGLMIVLWMSKDAIYGQSWSKRGDSGVFHNYFRKDDRLEKLGILSMSGENCDSVTASLIDALVDRALYGMMWICWLAKTEPDVFKMWIKAFFCPSTGIAYEDIERFLFEE